MGLRDYQQRAVDMMYEWVTDNPGKNPCMVLPTGAGKSHIIAEICKDTLKSAPDLKILMLTHVKELIEQNANKVRECWPNVPMGIYSAGLRKKQLGEPITFAGIQSIRSRVEDVGHIDIIIVDECHLISHKNEGTYRGFIDELKQVNPSLCVIGLTATPFRLGHGYITDKPALFDGIIEPVAIEELIYKGHLSTLRSKSPSAHIDVTGVKKRGGDYIESELQKAVDTDESVEAIVSEVMSLAGDRKSWLFFCTGVDHAHHVMNELINNGVHAECVTGKTPKKERARILDDFKTGKLKALTNANVLTTGFDAPNIDLIAMLRPTMSASLYVQMAGRGMRVKRHTDHCLVLDFAGIVEMHGPVTNVTPPTKKGGKAGEAPTKLCPECHEIVHLSVMECPECGYKFEKEEDPQGLYLRNDDIMGQDRFFELDVASWIWRKHTSRTSGKEMLAVTYYGSSLSDTPVTEYLTVTHDGYAGRKAMKNLTDIIMMCGLHAGYMNSGEMTSETLDSLSVGLTDSGSPSVITYEKNGKFHNVVGRSWK